LKDAMPDTSAPSPSPTHTLTVQVGTFSELAYQHLSLTRGQKDALGLRVTVNVDDAAPFADINVAAQDHLLSLIAPHMGTRYGLDVAVDWAHGIGQVLLTPPQGLPRPAATISIERIPAQRRAAA
jgi:hypothetical protein